MQQWEYLTLGAFGAKLATSWDAQEPEVLSLNYEKLDRRRPGEFWGGRPAPKGISAWLGRLGQDGWELVAILYETSGYHREYVFKRPKA